MFNIYKFEIKKILKTKLFIGSFVIFLLALTGIYFLSFEVSRLNDNAQQVAKSHEGDFTDEKLNQIIDDYMVKFQDERKAGTYKIENNMDVYTWFIFDNFDKNSRDRSSYVKIDEAVKSGKTLRVTDIDLKKISDLNFPKFNKPLYTSSYYGWYDLYNATSMVIMAIVIFTIILLAGIFAGDTEKNINQILLTTKYGRSKLISAKILAGFTITSGIFILANLLTYAVFLYYSSSLGWNTSIQLNFMLEVFTFPVELNQFQVYILLLLLQFTGLLAISGITLLLSSLSKASFPVLAISVGLYLLPLIFEKFNKPFLTKIGNLSPVKNQSVLELLNIQDRVFISNNFQTNLLFLMLIFISVALFSNIFVYQKEKHSYIK
ncbi:hypothetical protein BG262_00025 [Floricoccus penangensis]|uniref:ABC transporter permease n=1 Tax=Floricoccus penangensis TaxID=1859475 RepID=A0A9Q5JIF2_9LACT|nr:ABC transporter permease subunit [Floricoccus penangensis]OFI47945.1 hypothetical protein BG262_00025 [Floricoccus penangensis]